MRVANYPVLNNVDFSVNQTSTPINLYQIYMYAIQIVITGSPVGVVKLQVSCDNNVPQPGDPSATPQPTNWTDVNSSSFSVSGPSSYVWEDQASTYAWIRLVYTASSGTGNASARINVRGF